MGSSFVGFTVEDSFKVHPNACGIARDERNRCSGVLSWRWKGVLGSVRFTRIKIRPTQLSNSILVINRLHYAYAQPDDIGIRSFFG